MAKYLILFLLITISSCKPKDIKTFVMQERVDIPTISPDSTDFSDLQAIGKAIGDARVVMLGEQDHGDAPTFLAKSRLVKYLHEKMGFNVLAFESDFFALNRGWDQLEKQKSKIDPFISENIFKSWSSCVECENLLFDYIPKTFESPRPLIISGVDNQIHGAYSAKNLRSFLDDYLKSKKINYARTEHYKNNFLPFIDSIKFNMNLEKQLDFKKSLAQIDLELSTTDSTSFESILLRSLKGLTKSEISFIRKGDDYLELRDKQMAENLKWLVKHKFANEKVIVWAHSSHTLKNPELFKIPKVERVWKTMGGFFTADPQMAQQTYILGFTSRTGTWGRVINEKKYKVPPPEPDSFETWIPQSVPYAFVDFKKFREENPSANRRFLMKGRNHVTDLAPWLSIFDGVFYIRDMYPCALRKTGNEQPK